MTDPRFVEREVAKRPDDFRMPQRLADGAICYHLSFQQRYVYGQCIKPDGRFVRRRWLPTQLVRALDLFTPGEVAR